MCNACGLRYARSLSNKRKRSKDGTVVTVEATGDPSTVPPSRGSGGGSRPGVHRRTHKHSETQDEVPEGPSQSERLASVLASLPPASEPRAAPTTLAAPFAPSVDPLPHSVVMAAAAAAADSRYAMPSQPLGGMSPGLQQHTPSTAALPPSIPASAPPVTSDYLAPAPAKADYDPKALDAILSNTLLPSKDTPLDGNVSLGVDAYSAPGTVPDKTTSDQAPIFAALAAPSGAAAPQNPMKKSDASFSVPVDTMAVSASVTPTDAAIGGLLPVPAPYPEVFPGLGPAATQPQHGS